MDRLYLSLREIGVCDAKGKRLEAVGFRGKLVADNDKPLSSIVTEVIRHLLPNVAWKDTQAAHADLDELITTINKLKRATDNVPR